MSLVSTRSDTSSSQVKPDLHINLRYTRKDCFHFFVHFSAERGMDDNLLVSLLQVHEDGNILTIPVFFCITMHTKIISP
jgi:hypothetical protein